MIELSGCVLLVAGAFLIAPTTGTERRVPPMSILALESKLDRTPSLATDLTDINDPFEKRARLGFVGMRGKKYSNQDQPSSSFEDDNGTPPALINRLDDKAEDEISMMRSSLFHEPILSGYEQLLDKRAPSRGFHGMRGKKARSMGFMGMRGKKNVFQPNEENGENGSEDINGLLNLLMDEREKEALRIKRFAGANSWRTRGAKKAPLLGFFGMRGKRGPSSVADSTSSSGQERRQ